MARRSVVHYASSPAHGDWVNLSVFKSSEQFTCGYCGAFVGSKEGYANVSEGGIIASIAICPNCNRPTFMASGQQVPGPALGDALANLPPNVNSLYEEARMCTTANAPTAAVMVCRTLLMYVAVGKGAEPNRKFEYYVDWLAAKGYVPPDGESWVDPIRKMGNEAVHEIGLKGEGEAREILTFTEMLLRFIYDFPARVPKGLQK